MSNQYSLYLCHHGIMGQKWGKRNGPPYPLSPGAHSSSEKKANWRKSLASSNDAPRRRFSGSSTSADTTKADRDPDSRLQFDHMNEVPQSLRDKKVKTLKIQRALYVPVMFLGLPITSITGISRTTRALMDEKSSLKQAAEYQKERENSPIDSKTGLREKPNEMSIEEDVKRINPLYKDVTDQSKHNCVLCSVTYDLRRRGYDVTAKGAAIGYDNDEVSAWYNNKISYATIPNEKKNKVSVDNVINELSKDSGRGILNIGWPGGGGHAIAYDNSGGQLKIIDGQSAEVMTDVKDIKKALKHAVCAEYARTDNLTINPKLMLKEVVNQ